MALRAGVAILAGTAVNLLLGGGIAGWGALLPSRCSARVSPGRDHHGFHVSAVSYASPGGVGGSAEGVAVVLAGALAARAAQIFPAARA